MDAKVFGNLKKALSAGSRGAAKVAEVKMPESVLGKARRNNQSKLRRK